MAVPAFQFGLSRYRSLGSRKSFSRKLAGRRFERLLMVTKEVLKCFGKILANAKLYWTNDNPPHLQAVQCVQVGSPRSAAAPALARYTLSELALA